MNKDNNSGELAGQNGRHSSVNGNDGSPAVSSKQSPETAAAHAESRRRTISISEYKQRKKPEDVASSTSSPINNNDIHFKIEPGITIDTPLATTQTLPTIPKSNGQVTSIDQYYAQIYYHQHYLASQGQAYPPIPILHQPTTSTHPSAPLPAPSYSYWSTPTLMKPPEPPNINSTQSRMHRVEDWASTTPQRHPNPLKTSFNHSESPLHANNSFTPEKTQKLTPASALNDPNQVTSYREWRKRKYGTEDPPNSTPTNPSKYRRTDSWRDGGGPRGNNRSSAPASSGNSGLDNWDDDPAPAPAKNPVNLESWDDGPAPQPKKNDDMDNWDDDAASPEANKDVMKDLESWDDNSAPPKPSDDPPKNYDAWEANSTLPARSRAPQPASRGDQGTPESWDDGTTAEPPQPSQAALESWDDDPAPAAAANPVTIDDWEPTPVTKLPSSGNNESFWNAQAPSPRHYQDKRNNYRGNNRSRNDSGSHQSRDNYRGQRSNSRDNSESRGFRHDYRAGSRSSDNNSESGYSNYQNRGNRGRNRSGSRDNGQWNRNGSRDRSEGRQGWNSRNSNNYQDRRNNGGFNRSNDSWNQPPLPDATLESWDDDSAPPQPSKQMESWNSSNSSNNRGQSWNNSNGRGNYSHVQSTPVNTEELESWDNDEPPPQASAPEDWDAQTVGPVEPVQENVQTAEPLIIHNQMNNSDDKKSNMIKALCTTCSYQLVHRCKYTKDPTTWDSLVPGDLYICQCGMAFLHERDCIDKIGESYASEKSETALLKQVGRSLVYACDGCEFKFTIENIKEPVHFFKQLTIKKGDKLRVKAAINDPAGIDVFLHHIEGINNAACVGMDDAMKEKCLKDKMSSICHCNKGCCTVYHDCQVYEGIDDVGGN